MSKINKILIVLVIIALVSLPIFIYMQKSNTFTYNEYKFSKNSANGYDIEIFFKNDPSPHYINVRYNPKELERIPVETDLKSKLLKNEVYVTLDKNLTSTSVIAVAEISKIIGNQYLFNIPTKGALTYDTGKNLFKTCDDATFQTGIILLKLADETKITSDKKCVIVQGTNEDEIIRAATKLNLILLSIM